MGRVGRKNRFTGGVSLKKPFKMGKTGLVWGGSYYQFYGGKTEEYS